MDHNEAIKQMAVERYLLDELTPELHDAFEEHAFDCPECTLDLRAGAAFIGAAKVELPKLVEVSTAPAKPDLTRPLKKKMDWQSWLRPAFAVPAFAALLAIVSYQNLAMIPALRKAATEPNVLPSIVFHAGTRGSSPTPVAADHKEGAVLAIELPQESGFRSYAFDLYDPQGKQLWERTVSASKAASGGAGIVSLVVPGAGLVEGSYTLAISGTDLQGARTEIDRRVLDVHFDD